MPNSKQIKARMTELHITQKDVATTLGIAAPTVSQKINGVRPMNLDEARTLADMLHIDTGEFGEYFFTAELA